MSCRWRALPPPMNAETSPDRPSNVAITKRYYCPHCVSMMQRNSSWFTDSEPTTGLTSCRERSLLRFFSSQGTGHRHRMAMWRAGFSIRPFCILFLWFSLLEHTRVRALLGILPSEDTARSFASAATLCVDRLFQRVENGRNEIHECMNACVLPHRRASRFPSSSSAPILPSQRVEDGRKKSLQRMHGCVRTCMRAGSSERVVVGNNAGVPSSSAPSSFLASSSHSPLPLPSVSCSFFPSPFLGLACFLFFSFSFFFSSSLPVSSPFLFSSPLALLCLSLFLSPFLFLPSIFSSPLPPILPPLLTLLLLPFLSFFFPLLRTLFFFSSLDSYLLLTILFLRLPSFSSSTPFFFSSF